MKKLYLLAGLGVFLLLYISFGVPFLTGMVETQGVLVAFPIFILIYAVIAYVAGGMIKKSGKALVVFIAGFLAADTIMPPLLVSASGEIPALASSQLASDVFFFSLFRSWGIATSISYYLTYIGVPLLMFLVLALELKRSAFSRYLPKAVF